MPISSLTWDPEQARVHVVWTGTPAASVTIWRRAGRYAAPWTFVRSAYNVSGMTGLVEVHDYEMPIDGQEIEYVSKAGTAIPTEASPGTAPMFITVQADLPWLRHLGKPNLSLACVVESVGDPSRSGRLAIYEPHGRVFPVSVHDVRASRRGTVRLLTRTADESARMRAVTADGSPLLLQLMNGTDLDWADCYMAIEDAVEGKLSTHSKTPVRIWTLTYVETDRPAGDVQPAEPTRTYATVLTETPTYQAVRNDTPTYLQVLLGSGAS